MGRTGGFRVRVLVFAAVVASSISVWASPSAGAPAGRFDDDNGNVHEPMIEAVFAEGVASGCAPRLYCPAEVVSRAQMAAFLVRALGLGPATRDYFPDDAGSPHEDSINRVAEAGITSGNPDGTYGPSEPVLRGQMATFLAKGFQLGPTDRDYYSDDNGFTHEDNINRTARAQIAAGCSAGPATFCPFDPVRRDQMASFLGRALGLEPLPPGSTVLEGTGDAVPSFIKPEPGPALAVVTYTGPSNFVIWERNAAGERGNLLVNEIGDYSGTVLIDAPLFDDGDSTAFEITADGPWRIVIKPMSAAPRFGGPVTGRGDAVLVYTAPNTIARLTHDGQSNFAIWSYGGANDAELVVNEIGPYDGTRPFPRGERIIEVTADGNWSITPQ